MGDGFLSWFLFCRRQFIEGGIHSRLPLHRCLKFLESLADNLAQVFEFLLNHEMLNLFPFLRRQSYSYSGIMFFHSVTVERKGKTFYLDSELISLISEKLGNKTGQSRPRHNSVLEKIQTNDAVEQDKERVAP